MFPNTKLTNTQKNIVTFIVCVTVPIWCVPVIVFLLISLFADSIKSMIFEQPYNDYAARWNNYKKVHGIKD